MSGIDSIPLSLSENLSLLPLLIGQMAFILSGTLKIWETRGPISMELWGVYRL